MLSTLSNLFRARAEALGFIRKRQELVNSPEMQANARAKTDAEIKDVTREAIRKQDLKKIRELASE
jgi:lipopolysaccharide biosynthesis regulator YciM